MHATHLAPPCPARRATDAHRGPRRIDPSILRAGRFAIADVQQSDHMRGWVRYGMSQPLPADANDDMRAGYAAARRAIVCQLTAMEAPATTA